MDAPNLFKSFESTVRYGSLSSCTVFWGASSTLLSRSALPYQLVREGAEEAKDYAHLTATSATSTDRSIGMGVWHDYWSTILDDC